MDVSHFSLKFIEMGIDVRTNIYTGCLDKWGRGSGILFRVPVSVSVITDGPNGAES
jgi:hypothetical protein